MAMQIGFIGTGGMAARHMDALAKVPEARVAACADVEMDRAAEAAARFAGASAHSDFRRMLDEDGPDAVYVCVPPFAHGEIELELIERGIHFLVEKPLGLDRETPLRMLDALEGTDLVTSVGYVLRYRENVDRAAEFLAGEPAVVALGTYVCGIPGMPWWPRKELSGGQVNEQSTHLFDLARFLFGEVESVYCAARAGLITGVDGYSLEDASICMLRFESGLLCEITSSCAMSEREVSFAALTRSGRVELRTTAMDLTIAKGNETRCFRSADDALLSEDRAFVQAVLSGDASMVRSPYGDAVKTQLVTCAAAESMSSGLPVRP
jgi:myo-inositol 2-dehydrogenase/D-chiro-inositol 1-dehydrogenase